MDAVSLQPGDSIRCMFVAPGKARPGAGPCGDHREEQDTVPNLGKGAQARIPCGFDTCAGSWENVAVNPLLLLTKPGWSGGHH